MRCDPPSMPENTLPSVYLLQDRSRDTDIPSCPSRRPASRRALRNAIRCFRFEGLHGPG